MRSAGTNRSGATAEPIGIPRGVSDAAGLLEALLDNPAVESEVLREIRTLNTLQ
jgi:hypothetical protein